jgi:peptide/nickel transport system permease protein
VSNVRKPKDIRYVIGLTLVSLIFAVALLSLFWLPYAIDDTSGLRLEAPSLSHLLGTDKLGRDLLSRLMVGARVAFGVGAAAVLIGGLIGFPLGIGAGFLKRKSDSAASSLLDVLIAFPTLLVAMLIVAARGASLTSGVLAIGIGISGVIARITRTLTKSVLSKDFILASRASGTSWLRIVFLHILPNIWPTLLVAVALQFGIAGLAEASLSYLGLGAPPPNASWGSLLQEAQATVYVAPIAAIAPGLLLLILVLGINLIADGLRLRFDPTARSRT